MILSIFVTAVSPSLRAWQKWQKSQLNQHTQVPTSSHPLLSPSLLVTTAWAFTTLQFSTLRVRLAVQA